MSQLYVEFKDAAREGFAIGLAPMEGVGDFAFRQWLAAIHVPDFFVTPFLRVTPGFEFRSVSPLFCPEIFEMKGCVSVPVIPQFMGSDASEVCRLAESFLAATSVVDINCGCPSSTVFRHGAGSALLRRPDSFRAFLQRCDEILGPRKYSVKMRVGVSSSDEFDALVAAFEGLQPALITVHGRTQKEGYTGKSRWDLVERCARRVAPIPVCLSGDVTGPASLDAARTSAPSVKQVMIGRGVLSDPWVFAGLAGGVGTARELELVFWTLATHALFQEAQCRGGRFLFEFVGRLRPAERKLGFSVEGWRDFYFESSVFLFGAARMPRNLVCDGKVLLKTKQLLRQLAPERVPLEIVGLLRTSELSDLFDCFESSALKR